MLVTCTLPFLIPWISVVYGMMVHQGLPFAL